MDDFSKLYKMAGSPEFITSTNMTGEEMLNTFRSKANFLRDGKEVNPVTFGTNPTTINMSAYPPAYMEAVAQASRLKHARAKTRTASNFMRKLDSPFSRAQLIRLNDSKRDQDKSYIKAGHFPMYTSLHGIDRTFSEAQIEDLERVNIEDMLLGKRHRGQYLLVRTVSTPGRVKFTFSEQFNEGNLLFLNFFSSQIAMKDSVSVVIEDPKGRVDLLSIYNYPLGKIRTGPELDGIIPQGTIIAILEPLYEIPSEMPLNLAGGHVCVDSPTDISFLSTNDILVRDIVWSAPSPTSGNSDRIDWKERGNHFFKMKQYRAAIAKYSEGIQQLSNATTWTCKVGVLYLNRAAAHLLIGNYNAALQDSSKSLQMFDEVADWGEESAVSLKAKALFRVAKSLDGLRLYSKAKEAYLAVLAHDPMRSEASTAIARLDRRLDEARNGTHDICNMFRCASANFEGPLDVSDFVGPIRVQDMSNRGGGRGIVATRDITAGELLVVEKALAIAYKPMAGEPFISSFDFVTKKLQGTNNHVGLVKALVEKIVDNPDVGDVVDALYGGDKHSPASFPFDSRYLREADIPSKPPSSRKIDIERMEKICIVNTFSPEPVPLLDSAGGVVSERSGASGLYPLSSIFNHECTPSAVYSTWADIMVVRARKPIRAGQEITIAYQGYAQSYEERQEKLSTHFPSGGCQCELCIADKEDGFQNRQKRIQLLEESDAMCDLLKRPSRLNFPKLSSWFNSMDATYSKSRSCVRPELGMPSTLLFNHSAHAGDVGEYLRYTLIALQCQGIKLIQSPRKKGKGGKFSLPKVIVVEGALGLSHIAVGFILKIVFNFKNCGRISEANAWARAAFDVENMASGGGKAFFFPKYQKFFGSMGQGVEEFMRQQQ